MWTPKPTSGPRPHPHDLSCQASCTLLPWTINVIFPVVYGWHSQKLDHKAYPPNVMGNNSENSSQDFFKFLFPFRIGSARGGTWGLVHARQVLQPWKCWAEGIHQPPTDRSFMTVNCGQGDLAWAPPGSPASLTWHQADTGVARRTAVSAHTAKMSQSPQSARVSILFVCHLPV